MAFQFRTHENGGVCCSNPKNLCDKCKAHFGVRVAENIDDRYPSPDVYGPGLARLRAASSTPESRFEEQYKAERLAALKAEYARWEGKR